MQEIPKLTSAKLGFAALLLALCSSSLCAETVLTPRTAAEREADLKALEEKYAPRPDPQLEAQLRASGGVLPSNSNSESEPNPAQTNEARRLADAAALAALGGKKSPTLGAKVRIELYPSGLDKFIFDAQRYDRVSLQPVLAELGKQYQLDHIVLLNGPDALIELPHLVELAKLGKAMALPALYQLDQELKAVDTR